MTGVTSPRSWQLTSCGPLSHLNARTGPHETLSDRTRVVIRRFAPIDYIRRTVVVKRTVVVAVEVRPAVTAGNSATTLALTGATADQCHHYEQRYQSQSSRLTHCWRWLNDKLEDNIDLWLNQKPLFSLK